MLKSRSSVRRRRASLASALFLASSAGLLVGDGQPASGTHRTVTAVTGLAYGYRLQASLFGGVMNTRGYGQVACVTTDNPPGCAPRPESSSTPSVQLPAAGGSLSVTDPDGSFGTVGPAIFFSSGETTVSSEGTTGTSGEVTTSTLTTGINKSGQEQFTAASAASSCTASPSGVSGSVTITDGTLQVDSGWDANEDGDYIDPGEHDPVVVHLDGPIAPNTEFSGHLHISDPALDPAETWRWVFNEQVLNPDGSMTVHVGHQYIEGPTAVGDLWVGRADCGVTSEPAPSHDPPVASDDTYSTSEDTALTVAAPGVLANDVDPDGDALTAAVATGPSNGTVTLNANGSLAYTPNANFNGTDSFTYTVSDGNGADTGLVTMVVSAADDGPDAIDDAYTMNEDTTLTVAAAGVLGNDSDPEGDAFTAAVATSPAKGTLTLNADGSFAYTPNANFNGTDSFAYTAGNAGGSDTASVTITVGPMNDAPDAVNDAYSTNANTALTVAAPGVLGNDVDVDGDSLTATMASGPTKGAVTLAANGSFTYTPNAGVIGTDSFTYTASDGRGGSDTATATIAVHGADLSVLITDSPDPVKVGTNVTYTVRVTNNGPAPASGVTLSNTTVTNGVLGSVTPSTGTCTVSKTKVISCNLGNLASGGSATVQVVAKAPTKTGTMSLRATGSSTVPDPNSANNTATQSTAVVR